MYTLYWNEFWLVRFGVMLLGYATLVIPTTMLIIFIRRKSAEGSLEPTSHFRALLRNFAVGRPEYELISPPGAKTSQGVPSTRHLCDDCLRLTLYFAGIQTTLVAMGYLQERMITQGYILIADRSKLEKFADTQFLVLLNRIFALALSGVVLVLRWHREPVHVPPLYKHGYTSLSNTLSSWCQYEALKYVSFPTQTVCKASKILPTMLMGFFVRGERYSRAACLSALSLALGASLFFLSNNLQASVRADQATTVSGLCLMFGYLMFDAFTLNWQKTLFDTRPRVSKYQMMFGVNAFSMVLCLVSLAEQGSLVPSVGFMLGHEHFSRDAFLLSLAGALGQIVIYMTIERYGPIVFAVMMTLRQMFSITLSAFAYGHQMSLWSVLGLFVVFGSIFADIYRQYFKPPVHR